MNMLKITTTAMSQSPGTPAPRQKDRAIAKLQDCLSHIEYPGS